MAVYYNENDPYPAQWLRNLIAADLLPAGDVDERSIKDVQPDDLTGYTSCHFFAGIGGWPYALRLAGWPDDRPVWTGSCPCQPFSVAGKQKGFADDRHLWPEFAYLIGERRPPVVFGEQVAAASAWLAGVRSDLEGVGYAVGAIPVEAACAGAAQYRDRIWFVAVQSGPRRVSSAHTGVCGSEESVGTRDAKFERLRSELCSVAVSDHTERWPEEPGWNVDQRTDADRGQTNGHVAERGVGVLADRDLQHTSDRPIQREREFSGSGGAAEDHGGNVAPNPCELLDGSGNDRSGRRAEYTDSDNGSRVDQSGQLASILRPRLEERPSVGTDDEPELPPGQRNGLCGLVSPPLLGWGEGWTEHEFRGRGFTAAVASSADPLRSVQFIECPDGKWRRLPPPTVRWLGNGIPSRVAQLRAFGNSIYPPVAEAFIRAYLDTLTD